MTDGRPPLAGPPDAPTALPRALRSLVGHRAHEIAWRNQLGGIAVRVEGDDGPWWVKWAPAGTDLDLPAEATRLAWAAAYTPVPRVLEEGTDDEGTWLVLTALHGESAVSTRWKADPRTAVRAIGEGLRAFHRALPVASCPFGWSATDRLAVVEQRAATGVLDAGRWHRDHHALGVDEALARLRDQPEITHLVVCHGDACAPNTLLGADGRWVGHVDLGSLGVADPWADLAIATWSCDWNYGPGWDDELLAAYGIAPDPDRTSYYRLLWDLGP